MAGCGYQCMRIVLIFFNFLFFLVGAALLYLGIRAYLYIYFILEHGFNDPLLRGAIIIVMVTGGFILLVSFFGCLGACCENACMLHTYAAIVGLMLVLQIAGGILAAIYVSRLDNWLHKELQDSIDVYKRNDTRTEATDAVQVWLKCCGHDGPEDWSANNNSVKNGTWGNDFPASCCKLRKRDAYKIFPDNFKYRNCTHGQEGTYHSQGCYDSLKHWLWKNSLIIAAVALGLIFVEIVVLTMACCLKKKIDSESFA